MIQFGPLTHYHTMPHFDALKIYSCEKHREERRNCYFSFFHNVSALYGTYFYFKCTLKCRLEFVSICTSLKFCRLVIGCHILFKQITLRRLLKTLWEKQKMLVGSIFSFTHNVSSPYQGTLISLHLLLNYFVIPRTCFQIGRFYNVIVW